MSAALTEDIERGVKELIVQITGYEETSHNFRVMERKVKSKIHKSDTMYFLSPKDIKSAIWSMADKFSFHSFFKQADYLKQAHDKYIDLKLEESELLSRLNIVKFLMEMSQNPIDYFWQNPKELELMHADDLEDTVEDWGAYLNEGMERWSPIKDDSFLESDLESDETQQKVLPEITTKLIKQEEKLEVYDFSKSRSQLLETIQHGWFDGAVSMKPPSDSFDANVALLWEEFLRKESHGLIEMEPLIVISEYKVMREILWQMWGPHRSAVFTLSGDRLIVNSNISISSIRSMTFESFLRTFLTYIHTLHDFMKFFELLSSESICETYRGYGCGVKKIVKPFFDGLLRIEHDIKEQDTTMTLQKLQQSLEKLFEPIRILKNLHSKIIPKDYEKNSNLQNALTLLKELRDSLHYCLNKLERDICLTLYLESLFYYLTMTDAWLVKNDLFDDSQEFVIINNNINNWSRCESYHMNFKLCDSLIEDGLVKIIGSQVLQIGRNIHLLRLLGKFDVFVENDETIYEEFIRRILEEISDYYGHENLTKSLESVQVLPQKNSVYDWADYVDMTDQFLVQAFEDYLQDEPVVQMETPLYEKISIITKDFFPLEGMTERVFEQILRERFTISGLMVKNLLIDKYQLDKQFEFLNRTFLHFDDFIFPFYRRLFLKMNTANSNWGNSVWLTSNLQDIVMDYYPNFYENCTVQVNESWKQCRDSLEACTLIKINYALDWPLNIIITNEQIDIYREIFQFILKLKWALYTINHLNFTDLESKRCTNLARNRLMYLRFHLINILNSLQHYVFVYVFNKSRMQFDLDFKNANDLVSLIEGHERFVKEIHGAVCGIRDVKSNEFGFASLLKSVKMLKVMWNNLVHASGDNLNNCFHIYKMSFNVVNPVINPLTVFS